MSLYFENPKSKVAFERKLWKAALESISVLENNKCYMLSHTKKLIYDLIGSVMKMRSEKSS